MSGLYRAQHYLRLSGLGARRVIPVNPTALEDTRNTFICGANRYLGRNARLVFRQYKLEV